MQKEVHGGVLQRANFGEAMSKLEAPRAPIQGALDRLDEELAVLEKAIDQLEAKLGPVMRGPDPEAGLLSMSEDACCEIEGSILAAMGRVHAQRRRLDALIDRVQL